MPGAPNRPPESAAAAPAAAPTAEAPVLRRLVPSQVVLLQDLWKGAVPPDVLAPFERAEAALAAADLAGAQTALDLLSIRFAEPRWPSLPEPYRRLRVAIPAPMPPNWDPEHALPAAERDARRARRATEDQILLAAAALDWARAHGVEAADLLPRLQAARDGLGAEGVPPAVTAELDALWAGLRPRLPRPRGAAAPRAPPPEVPTDGTTGPGS